MPAEPPLVDPASVASPLEGHRGTLQRNESSEGSDEARKREVAIREGYAYGPISLEAWALIRDYCAETRFDLDGYPFYTPPGERDPVPTAPITGLRLPG